MLRQIVFIIIITTLALISCNRDGNSRTNIKTTDFEIPEQPPTQQNSPAPQLEIPTEQLFRDACLEGNMNLVNDYISAGGDIHLKDEDGRTGLMLAAFNGHTDLVKILIDQDAEINTTDIMGRTALMYASTGHFPATVELLLNNGAEPNIADSEEGFTALMFAGAEGNLEVVRLLLEYGANPDLKDKDNDTAEIFARQNGHTEVADYLKESMGK